MTVTIRDLEATFKDLGFSNRRSKAGAAAAWKALSGEEESPLHEPDANAEIQSFAAMLAAELGKNS